MLAAPVRFRSIAGFVVLPLLLSGCFYFPSALSHQEHSPETRPWWCDSTGADGGHHSGHHYDGVEKGMLDWSSCETVSAQFDLALDYAQQFPTLGDAEAAGFHGLVPYVAGMGTHHAPQGDFTLEHFNSPKFDPHEPVFPGTALDGDFNPMRPEFLQYDGNGPDAQLVGMSWYVRTDNGMPPPGFKGDNDFWHVHERLCFRTSNFTFAGENLTDETCENRGGRNLHLDDYWMAHAWIVPGWEHEPDVFVNHHPCLLPGGPAAEDHECWDASGDDHDGHG